MKFTISSEVTGFFTISDSTVVTEDGACSLSALLSRLDDSLDDSLAGLATPEGNFSPFEVLPPFEVPLVAPVCDAGATSVALLPSSA